ncbi:MAG: P-II family nitrogen regulator [Succinivibrio sp.]
MLAVTAIVRPEKIMNVQDALYNKGFSALTKATVSGRGKEKGIKVGDVLYEEMTKVMLYLVVPDDEKDLVVSTIMQSAMTGEKGNPGDGKIFISPVYESYTISSQSLDGEL